MFQKLGRWPGIITKKTKQLLEKDVRIVQKGLDAEGVIPLVDNLSAQPDNSESVTAESLRSLIDRMITDVGQIAASIKIKAEAEAQEEAVKIIDQAKQGAADIRKSVAVAAGKEAEEVLAALKNKTGISQEDARKKAQLYLLKVRQEIELEVREEYRRTHSRLLYSLLSTSDDGAISAKPLPFPPVVKELADVVGREAKKTAWDEEKARAEVKMALAVQKQAEKEAEKAARAEEKARAEEIKKTEAARKQAEKEAKKAARAKEKARADEANIALRESKHPEKEARPTALTGAEDTASSDANIAQKENPAVSETEPAAGEAAPGEIPSQVIEDDRGSDVPQPVAPVSIQNDSSLPESGEMGADEEIEQADAPDKEESGPAQSTEQVNETAVEKPAVEGRENQPEAIESVTEKQAVEQTMEEPTLTEPDESGLAQMTEGPVQPEATEITLEQMVAKVARPKSDEKPASSGDKAVTRSTQKQPPVDEPEVEKISVAPLPPLDTKAVYTGEVELAISVPVDPVAVSKLYNQLQSTPDMKILHTRGSWDRGTIITVSLDKPLPLIGIISDISGIAITPVNAEKSNIPKTGSLLGATRQGVTRIDLSIKEI